MNAATSRPRNEVLVGDAQETLARLPDASVDLVVTSPPYFRLRDYGITGQLGLETNIDSWVGNLRQVTRQIERILTPTGSLWLNLGDSYATHPREGAPRKSLLLGPDRLLLALQADGWLVRNKIVWSKTNPVPSPVRDRLAATWEVVFFLVRRPSYYFDLDAIRQPHRSRARAASRPPASQARAAWRGPNSLGASGLARLQATGRPGHLLGKNPGDVWPIGSARSGGGHHATFPLTFADRVIRAACPRLVCNRCGAPWVAEEQQPDSRRRQSACACDAPKRPGLVLDPFIGSGTTAVAAENLERDWLGIELNADYAAQASQRIDAARAARHRQRKSKGPGSPSGSPEGQPGHNGLPP
ncbi:site-specific DNA-methyltransferase [Geodermatophilus sp. DF01-2]|uniref:DNA-methyltransferase n=1 Tax=Geodermatophilus sp. DF01-2 TaxID=2559610 RepID=UPI001072F2E5|nr:site-specific DNA-methyltransferase [Geodermatophilus sp. DF01_2]TFV62034.1 site-specific DNA-methyltransferase [Geodermatophilus sp. DF01_2]